MSKKDLYELIEAFINGALDPEEMASVKERIENDENFANEVKLHRELTETFGDSEVDEFSNIIKKVIDGEIKTSSILDHKWLILAGIIFFSIVSIWIGKSLLSKPDPQKLYRQYADFPISQEYAGPNLARSGGDEVLNKADSLWLLYYSFYNQQDYSSAEEVLLKLGSMDPLSNQLQIQNGLVKAMQEEYEDAIQHFERAKEVQDMAFWYLGLTYLKVEDIENAQNNFSKISSTIHPRSEQSKRLLKKLGY